MPGKCIHHDAVCLVLLFSLFLWLIGMCFHHCCCRVLFFMGYASKYKVCCFVSLFNFFILVILLSIFNLNFNITLPRARWTCYNKGRLLSYTTKEQVQQRQGENKKLPTFCSSSTASSRHLHPLRQMTIPMNNEEEGLGNTKQGRCRVLLLEWSAALRIRTLPLSKLAFQYLKQRNLLKGSADDLKLLAYAPWFITTCESSLNVFTDSDSFVSRLFF